jgi:hypothetical protein
MTRYATLSLPHINPRRNARLNGSAGHEQAASSTPYGKNAGFLKNARYSDKTLVMRVDAHQAASSKGIRAGATLADKILERNVAQILGSEALKTVE